MLNVSVFFKILTIFLRHYIFFIYAIFFVKTFCLLWNNIGSFLCEQHNVYFSLNFLLLLPTFFLILFAIRCLQGNLINKHSTFFFFLRCLSLERLEKCISENRNFPTNEGSNGQLTLNYSFLQLLLRAFSALVVIFPVTIFFFTLHYNYSIWIFMAFRSIYSVLAGGL